MTEPLRDRDNGPAAPSGWIAHDEPERRLQFGAWLCACEACRYALEAAVGQRPGLELVVKRAMGRTVLGLDEFLTAGVDSTLAGPDDHVREVFVAAPLIEPSPSLPAPARDGGLPAGAAPGTVTPTGREAASGYGLMVRER